jgi:hypothetical protein
MIDQSISHGHLISHPAFYRIRVSSRLDPDWSERLQGMEVSVVEGEGHGTVTELSGLLPDQAALMGVLDHLYNFGIPLLRVECFSAGPEKE